MDLEALNKLFDANRELTPPVEATQPVERWVSWDQWQWEQTEKIFDALVRKHGRKVKSVEHKQRQLDAFLRYKSRQRTAVQ